MTRDSIPRRWFLAAAGAAAASALGKDNAAKAQGGTVSAVPVAPAADIILKNAKIITLDPGFTITQAVAVAGERILAVGPEAAMAAHTAPWTHTSHR